MRRTARLAAWPWIKHVSSDLFCRKSDEYTVGATGADIALAQYGLSGAGVTVAVLDSGGAGAAGGGDLFVGSAVGHSYTGLKALVG